MTNISADPAHPQTLGDGETVVCGDALQTGGMTELGSVRSA